MDEMSETRRPTELAREGQLAYEQKEYLSAAGLFKAASDGFKLQQDDLDSAEQLNNASVAFLLAGQAEEALEVCEGTIEPLRLAGDGRRLGMACGNMGSALEALGRHTEAIRYYQESGELLDKAGEDQLKAHVLQSLSRLQLQKGHQFEAIATMQESLAGINKPNVTQRLLKKIIDLPFRLLNK
jgi:tetratricopeptide (TPR) repeat protein